MSYGSNTNIGRTDDEQLKVNVEKLRQKILDGYVTREELLDARRREILNLARMRHAQRKLDYVVREYAALLEMKI